MNYCMNLIALPLILTSACVTDGQTRLGFDVSNAIISPYDMREGGPPPDGIPSIDNPRFTRAEDVMFLDDDDIVIGYARNGDARAYPFRILIWHEIVNDTVGGKPVAVTYCPLCGTAMVMGREYGGRVLTFGVSGLLYNSDVLMFDRQTRGLWSQIGLKAVSGEYVGTEMEWLPSEQMTWEAWRERHPESVVLNTNTGHQRDYRNLPYESYFASNITMFPYERNRRERDLSVKDWVAGARHGGAAKAYPLDAVPTGKWVDDTIGGEAVRFHYDKDASLFRIRDTEGGDLPIVHVFWFAWQAFYPETEVWRKTDG